MKTPPRPRHSGAVPPPPRRPRGQERPASAGAASAGVGGASPARPHEVQPQRVGARSQGRGAKTPNDALRTLRTPTGQRDAVEVLGSKEATHRGGAVERLDERVRARRRGWLYSSLTAVAAVVVAGALAWVVFFSTVFALDAGRITVEGGDERFTNESARELVAAHVGTPITRLSMSAVAGELAAVAQVKDAVVSRVWPAGIDVKLTMRVPVMAEKTAEGFVLLDDEAVALATQGSAPDGLPVVVLPGEQAQRIEAAESLAIVRASLPESVVNQVANWSVESHQIHFTLVDGRLVKWGTRDNSELKGKVLPLLVEQRGAQVYDVSSPTSPVTS